METPTGVIKLAIPWRNKRYNHENDVRIGQLFSKDWVMETDLGMGRRFSKDYVRRRKQIQAVFFTYLDTLLRTCLRENTGVKLPVAPASRVFIRLKSNFEHQRILSRKGIYRDVNLIESDGRIYQFAYSIRGMKYPLWVRIPHAMHKEMVRMVNEGQRFAFTKPLREISWADLVDEVAARYPHIDPKAVRKIVVRGCRSMNAHLQTGRDVTLQSTTQKVKFQVYHYKWKPDTNYDR